MMGCIRGCRSPVLVVSSVLALPCSTLDLSFVFNLRGPTTPRRSPLNSKMSKQYINADAQRVLAAVKTSGTNCFVTGVQDLDGSGSRNVDKASLAKVAAIVHETVKDLVLILIAAGKDKVALYVSIPEGNEDKLKANELKTAVAVEGDAHEAFGEMSCDPEQGEYPLKKKDEISGECFAALRKAGLLGGDDSDSDDEVLYGFDD